MVRTVWEFLFRLLFFSIEKVFPCLIATKLSGFLISDKKRSNFLNELIKKEDFDAYFILITNPIPQIWPFTAYG